MENYNEINKRIGQNLACYRKEAGLTQAELAEKINYSDKSVSKWEQGNGIPDVYVLMQLARLYGVTLNDLVGEEAVEKVKQRKQRRDGFHLLIMLLSCGIVWLVATYFFVSMEMWKPSGDWWVAFIYAVAITAVVLIVYASIWKYRILHFASVSTLIWTVITCVYLTVYVTMETSGSLWLLFVLGVPLQALEILWVFFRSFFSKNAKRRKKKSEKTVSKENTAETVADEEK
ncbi:MAG: helix-turn-helix transcriptional regulator [Clostridia bacterium]|nr:helix-turn-helix transcriptional regulator [Clostridia bacterium]